MTARTNAITTLSNTVAGINADLTVITDVNGKKTHQIDTGELRLSGGSFSTGGNFIATLGINATANVPLHVSRGNLSIASRTIPNPTTFVGATGANSNAYFSTAASRTDIVALLEGEVVVKDYVWVSGSLTTSDMRIKRDFSDLNDNESLERLRSIPVKRYGYRDTGSRGVEKTIGFIAQEVSKVVPEAVVVRSDFLPDVYKIIECEWREEDSAYGMSSDSIDGTTGTVFKFMVWKDEIFEEVESELREDGTFRMNRIWDNVFCYGRKVNDLNVVNKDKLFTLCFSAVQELDKICRRQDDKLNELEMEIHVLKEKV